MSDRRGVSVRALRIPNYRRYFSAQLISNTGVWFQNLSIALIVAQATGSASALALVTVCQFGPVLLLSTLAGRVVDAISPRRVMMVTALGSSAVSGGLALAIGLDPEHPHLLVLYLLMACGGCVAAFDRAAAQAIVFELVGPSLLQNGVVLATVYLSAARSIGPGLAGLAFVGLGPTACMVIAAIGYLAQFALVAGVRPDRLTPRPPPEGASPSVLANLRVVARNAPLLAVLLVNVVVTVGAMNFNVVLTAVVSLEFGGDATQLGATHALNAVGAVAGALLVTVLSVVRPRTLVPAVLAFGVSIAVVAAAPNLTVLLAVAPVLGIGLGMYQSVLNSAAQSVTPPHALGRTMSLLTMGNLGMAPVGSLLVGLLIDATTGRTALVLGAVVCALAAAGLALALRLTGSGRGRGARPLPEVPGSDAAV